MNKKQRLSLVIAVLLLTALFPSAALAASSVTVQASPSRAQVGETVTVSGTAVPEELLSIKVTDEDGNIVYFGAARADPGGAYQTSFTVPNLSPQTLTVVAGSGSDVATAQVEIYVQSTPTATPTPEPTIHLRPLRRIRPSPRIHPHPLQRICPSPRVHPRPPIRPGRQIHLRRPVRPRPRKAARLPRRPATAAPAGYGGCWAAFWQWRARSSLWY